MKKHTDGVAMFYAPDRAVWRQWLAAHHRTESAVWLVYYKPASGKPRVSYDDAVDEALCFGWIDSKPNKLDEHRSLRFFAPRHPRSNWSKLNKERVVRLTQEGRMTEAGRAAVAVAKENGTWDALNEVEALVVSDDLQEALRRVPQAEAHFEAFPPSSKKNILDWIHNAKRAETRQKRIEETAQMAEENLRANHYRQPKRR